MKRSIFFLSSLFLALGITSCGGGGGGGGGEFIGAAEISLNSSPSTIDTQDRTKVQIRISNVIDTGVILKVRYSNKLSYSVNTALLKLDNEDQPREIEPSFNGSNDDTTYLVYFLSRSLFGDTSVSDPQQSEPATLSFELVGTGRLKDGKIEADADVNDPTISDDVEFNVTTPSFEAETEASIEVKESSN